MYKVNYTANEMIVQTFSEGHQINLSIMPMPGNLRVRNSLISDGCVYYWKQREHQETSGPCLLTALL